TLAIGSIMYAMTCTRPDVSFALSMVSRHQQNPGEGLSQDTYLDKILKRFRMENSKKGNMPLHHVIKISKDLCPNPGEGHWTAVKNILKYLRNTKDRFLVYGGERELRVTVADSTCESEYITACEASKEAIWMKNFIGDLGVVPTVQGPIEIFCDNESAGALTKEPKDHEKSKHIEKKYHFVRSKVEEVRFDITSLSSNKNNVYDILQNEIQRFYPNEAVEVKEVGRIPFCLDFQDGTVITDTRHHMDYMSHAPCVCGVSNHLAMSMSCSRPPFRVAIARTYEDFERLTGPIHLPLQDIIEGLIWLHNEGLSHGNVCPCNVVVCRLEHYSMDSPYAEGSYIPTLELCNEHLLKTDPEANDLVKGLINCRLTLHEVMLHPRFWMAHKALDFIKLVSDHVQAGQWSRNREHRLLESALQQMKALIRAFRNGYSHILDNSKGVEQLRYDSGSFMMMIREAYPNLVLLLFKNLPPEFRNKREFSILLSRD
nr:hypothetical protein [Tanacetum cinerariifolium]